MLVITPAVRRVVAVPFAKITFKTSPMELTGDHYCNQLRVLATKSMPGA